jgi:tRNA(Leu) C34 or U34 (ribose-2'-O)-methylase TrmL
MAMAYGATDLCVMSASPHLMKKFACPPLNIQAVKNPARLRKSAKFDQTPIVQLVTAKMDMQAESLIDFHHPEDAIYTFGTEKTGSPENLINDENSCFVTIPTLFGRSMWAQQVATSVLYDRWAKRGGA